MNDNDYFFVDRSAEHKARRERLAHNNDENPNYLKTRKHYAWWKYIRLRSNHK